MHCKALEQAMLGQWRDYGVTDGTHHDMKSYISLRHAGMQVISWTSSDLTFYIQLRLKQLKII